MQATQPHTSGLIRAAERLERAAAELRLFSAPFGETATAAALALTKLAEQMRGPEVGHDATLTAGEKPRADEN